MNAPQQYSSPPILISQDDEHLRLLEIFHYVLGAITILFSCIFITYIAMGILMIANPKMMDSPNSPPPPAFMGYMFATMGAVAVLGGWTLGGLTIFAGRCLHKRINSTLIIVVAALNCLNVPIGTTLGVFTIIVLQRPSVRFIFNPSLPFTH